MVDFDLDKGPRRPAKRAPKTVHNWRLPAGSLTGRVIDNLAWQLEAARDDLVDDFHRAAKRRGCSHFVDAPGDPLSAMFTVYDQKIDRAMIALKRALR